jgi:hypothetical protein
MAATVDAQVKVKRRGDDQKFLAKVLAIGTECDIALLTVEVPSDLLSPMPCRAALIAYPIIVDRRCCLSI